MPQLEFHYTVMGNSKSAQVATRAYSLKEAGKKALIAKPGVDTKGGQWIKSRIQGLEVEADLVYSPSLDLYDEITNRHRDQILDEVIIDEAQFSTPQQIEQLYQVAWLVAIPVICYGLKHDFQSRLFPGSQRLVELADRLVELEKIKRCECGEKASYNVRRVNGSYTFEGSQVLIDDGSQVEYVSICPRCFLKAGGLRT
jgi:thymidine kinase